MQLRKEGARGTLGLLQQILTKRSDVLLRVTGNVMLTLQKEGQKLVWQ